MPAKSSSMESKRPLRDNESRIQSSLQKARSDRTCSQSTNQAAFSFEWAMQMLTRFSDSVDKALLQMSKGIALRKRSSEYEVCLGSGATAALAGAKPLGLTVAVIFMCSKRSACGLQRCGWLQFRTKPQRAPIWSLRLRQLHPG